jgi:hypothetical protein
MGTVDLPDLAAALLVKGALEHVASADGRGGCCPLCCASCVALMELLDAGVLDEVVSIARPAPGTSDVAWWADDQVNRDLLDRVWAAGMASSACHTGTHRRAATGEQLVRYVTVQAGYGVVVMVPAGTDPETVQVIKTEVQAAVRYFLAP